MGRSLNHKTTLDRVRARANETEDKLNGLKAWKVDMEKKFDTSEKVRKELEEHMETMRKVLKDKEREIKDAKDQLCQSKEAAIHEYRDSNALLEELETSDVDGFDDVILRPRKLILTLTFLNSTLIRKPKLLLSPLPLRVRRICLLMMQFWVTKSQLLFKAKPSPSRVMLVSLRMLSKRML